MFQPLTGAQWHISILISLLLSNSATFAQTNTPPTCSPPAGVTSEALVRTALQCNAAQKAMASRWQAQQQRVDIADRLKDPTLTVGAAPHTFGEDQLDNGYLVEFKQLLPWPGVLSLHKQAATAQSNAWRARVNQGQIALARDVRLRYAQWRYYLRLRAVNHQHQQLWQEFIAIVETKYASGTTSKSAVLQARHEHHLLLQEAIELNASIERSNSQLRGLINLPSETPLGTMNTPTTVPSISLNKSSQENSLLKNTLPKNAVATLLSQLSQQPTMQRMDARRRQKTSEIALAEKDRYPSFSVMTRYNSLWANEEQRWVVGVGVNLPFDSGKRNSRERSLQAEQRALRWEQQDLLVQLREQLMQTLSSWRQAKNVHQLYQEDLLPLAQESLATAQVEYQSGVGNFLSLLTAQRQTLTTQRKALLAMRNQVAQFANLTAAAGLVELKEWESLGEQP